MSTPARPKKSAADRVLAVRRRADATLRVHKLARPPRLLTWNRIALAIRRRLPGEHVHKVPMLREPSWCAECSQPWPCDASTLANVVQPLALAVGDGLAACSELEAETRLLSPIHLSPYRDAARKIAAVMDYRLTWLPDLKETRND